MEITPAVLDRASCERKVRYLDRKAQFFKFAERKKISGIVKKYNQFTCPSKKSGEKKYIALEQYDSDLLQMLLHNEVSSKEKLSIIDQLLNELEELEKNGIIHGDLKPENILAKTGSHGDVLIALADFAFATFDGFDLDGMYGTPAFVAPECWVKWTSSKEPMTMKEKTKIDAWALFITLLLVFDFPLFYHAILFPPPIGRDPFRHQGCRWFTAKKADHLENVWKHGVCEKHESSWVFSDLIAKMNKTDPTDRPSIGEINAFWKQLITEKELYLLFSGMTGYANPIAELEKGESALRQGVSSHEAENRRTLSFATTSS